MIRKFFRAAHIVFDDISSFLRVLRIRFLYPGVQIRKCRIEKNCKIACVVGAQLVLDNCHISAGSQIVAAEKSTLEIRSTFIGRNCSIVSQEKILIEAHCQIAELVVIRDQNHNYGTPDTPIAEQGFSTAPVHIKKNVWLAAKSTVLAGTTIGENTVLAAHAVARLELEPNSVYAGIPAKKIKSF